MGYQQAIARITEIIGSPTPSQAAPPSGDFAAQMQQQLPQVNAASAGRGALGIPAAAYTAPAPVQQGKLQNSLFKPRLEAARIIANRFGLQITSDYRTPAHNAQVGGVPNSFHTKGLAFDFTGSQMEKAKAFAEAHPEIFQEVLMHDAGSGMHLHLAFRSG